MNVLIPFAAPQTVDTHDTILVDWRGIDTGYKDLLFAVVNLDPTNAIRVTLETSEDGEHSDVNVDVQEAPPGKQVSILTDNERSYYRLYAAAVSGTAAIKFQMSGT